MAYTDLFFHPVAELMRSYLETAVSGLSDPPAAVELRYGNEVAFDMAQHADVCCSGLAWVRMGTVTPGWPTADTGVRNCIIPAWSMALEVGIVRCAPTGDDQYPPTGAEHAAAAAALAEDFMAIRRLICLFSSSGYDFSVSAWTPVGPMGGCMGSTMTFNVMIIAQDSYA